MLVFAFPRLCSSKDNPKSWHLVLALDTDSDLAWLLHVHVLHSNAFAWNGELPQVEEWLTLWASVSETPLRQHRSSSFSLRCQREGCCLGHIFSFTSSLIETSW